MPYSFRYFAIESETALFYDPECRWFLPDQFASC